MKHLTDVGICGMIAVDYLGGILSTDEILESKLVNAHVIVQGMVGTLSPLSLLMCHLAEEHAEDHGCCLGVHIKPPLKDVYHARLLSDVGNDAIFSLADVRLHEDISRVGRHCLANVRDVYSLSLNGIFLPFDKVLHVEAGASYCFAA